MGDLSDSRSRRLTGSKYALLQACKRNTRYACPLRKADIRKLIDAGADVNTTDDEGKTALFYAVQQRNDKDEGETALFYAVQKWDNKDMVCALIDAGADVNTTDDEGKTALFYSVQQRGNKNVVHAFIDAGVDVNTTDNKGKTALFYSVQLWNNQDVVRALIDAGADVNTTDDEGKTALSYAVQQRNNKDVVRALIDAGVDVNTTDNKGKTALICTVQQRNTPDMVRALIDAGADVNITDNEGKTALLYTVQQRNTPDMVHALIDAGADVNITDNEGKTALLYAVQQSDNKDVVNALINAGADVNITDNVGETALFYAIEQYYNKDVVNALIDAGAHLKVRNHYGKTPLFYARTKSGSLAINLLERWAHLYQKDIYSILTILIEECSELPGELQNQFQILIEIKRADKKQILKAILSFAFCKILSFNRWSCSMDVHSLSALLRLAGEYTSALFDVRKQVKMKEILKTIDEPQQSVLKPEVLCKILRQLVKLGANPSSADWDGNTALHHVIHLSSYGVPERTVLDICNQLKELGASFHIKNCNKETPLLHCLASIIKNLSSHGSQGWLEVQTQLAVCQSLIEHGSDVEEKEQHGQSALHLLLQLLQRVILGAYKEPGTRCLNKGIMLLRKILIAHKEKGLHAVIRDDSGNTPFHIWATFQLAPGQDYSITIAEGYTFRGFLKMILDHISNENKTQLHLKNENGETPLHLCRTWTSVQLLLDAGANPKDVDSSGRSPLDVAAKNSKLLKNQVSLYPDIFLPQDKFWREVFNKGFDPWMVDFHNESVLSVLIESKSQDLARALVDVACDDSKVRSHPLILFSLLTAICKDKLPNAQWKKDAAERILSLPKCPVNGNEKEDSPLHYCCRNILEDKKSLSRDQIKSTVHWKMVKLLRSFGADYRIPDARGQSCLEIAEECPTLKDLLMEPIDLDRFPIVIKSWKSVSKMHERCLTKVAKHLESKYVEPYWYHKDHFACGTFGSVYAGINEKDGREVAIKRIEKRHMKRPEDQREIVNLTALADCEQVIRYLAFFEDNDFSYIVLELMEGNLEDLLNKSITMKKREELCNDVVKGLSYMHSQGYLHRDLKPTNILFKNFPKLCLKIADFGLSRHTDSTQRTTVYGTNAGTRCWIAPEVLTATKHELSAASDMFSCGLVFHHFLSVRMHPFSPVDCTDKGELQICNETETNIINGNKEGWDDSLSPEAANLLQQLLERDATKRPTAAESLAHPLFWSKSNKMNFLIALGNQPEIECPLTHPKRTLPLTAVETELQTSFSTIVKYIQWNDPGYVHMPAIYTKMSKWRKYDTYSVVELVRFIRNAHEHYESTLAPPTRKQLLEDFLFLEYFPNLVVEAYKVVTIHGWDQTREEIKFAMKK